MKNNIISEYVTEEIYKIGNIISVNNSFYEVIGAIPKKDKFIYHLVPKSKNDIFNKLEGILEKIAKEDNCSELTANECEYFSELKSLSSSGYNPHESLDSYFFVKKFKDSKRE
jgi:hypothetical protein